MPCLIPSLPSWPSMGLLAVVSDLTGPGQLLLSHWAMSPGPWGLRTDSLTPHCKTEDFPLAAWAGVRILVNRLRPKELRFRTSKKGVETPTVPPVQCKYLLPLCGASPQSLALSNLPTILWVEVIILILQLRKLGLRTVKKLPKVVAKARSQTS